MATKLPLDIAADRLPGRLRQVREAYQFTYTNLASATGVSRAAIVRAERGELPLRWDQLERIAQFFGLETADFLAGAFPPDHFQTPKDRQDT